MIARSSGVTNLLMISFCCARHYGADHAVLCTMITSACSRLLLWFCFEITKSNCCHCPALAQDRKHDCHIFVLPGNRGFMLHRSFLQPIPMDAIHFNLSFRHQKCQYRSDQASWSKPTSTFMRSYVGYDLMSSCSWLQRFLSVGSYFSVDWSITGIWPFLVLSSSWRADPEEMSSHFPLWNRIQISTAPRTSHSTRTYQSGAALTHITLIDNATPSQHPRKE